MNIYALYVEGRFIKAVIGIDNGIEMLYRFLSGVYYRINPEYRLSFQWLTLYRVRVFKRDMNSFSILPAYIGEAELRRIEFIHNHEPQSLLENEEPPSNQLLDNEP